MRKNVTAHAAFVLLSLGIAALSLPACSRPVVPLEQALDVCARGASFVEVTAHGTVARVLGISASRTGRHQGFLLRDEHLTVRVEHNATIGGAIPLTPGEAVTLQGQYECTDGVIHWTHHDPRGRHSGGFIQAGGKLYT